MIMISNIINLIITIMIIILAISEKQNKMLQIFCLISIILTIIGFLI